MTRWLGMGSVLTLLAVGSAVAAEPPSYARGGLNDNAALKYWQAFSNLARLSDKEQDKLQREAHTMPLDARAKEIVEGSEGPLRELHNGAAVPQCAWGVSIQDGVVTLLNHCMAARQLGGIATLRARLRFEEGKTKEAVDDLIAAFTLGRHVTLDGTIIGLLVGGAMEHSLTETLASNLSRLDAPALRELSARLDKLPPGGDLATAVGAAEYAVLDYLIREVRRAKGKEQLLDFLTRILESGRAAEEFLNDCGGTADGIVKYAEQTRPAYGEMARLVKLAQDAFDKEWTAFNQKHGKANPVFRKLAPALDKCRQADTRLEVRRALRKAALAILLDGPDAAKAHKDPTDGKPFDYTAFDGGFELRSRLVSKEKPLMLAVGRAPK